MPQILDSVLKISICKLWSSKYVSLATVTADIFSRRNKGMAETQNKMNLAVIFKDVIKNNFLSYRVNENAP